ncbi:hypothetical protein CEXT_790531, partial [Caerostris extrusa]
LTCIVMRDLFNHLLEQLNDDHSIGEMRKLIESYESTATTMRSMDDFFLDSYLPCNTFEFMWFCSGLATG